MGLEGTGCGGFCTNPSTGGSHSLMLPGDFNFIYNQDENPSSINLGEQQQKKGLKKNHGGVGQGVGEHPEEEEEEEEEPIFHWVPN